MNSRRQEFFYGCLVGIGALASWIGCDSSNPPAKECTEAMAEIQTACCPGGPDHGNSTGSLEQSSVTYKDCNTDQVVTVPCTPGAGFPEFGSHSSSETDGGSQDAGTPDSLCQDALKHGEEACGGEFSAQDFELDCGSSDPSGAVLPSCAEIQALADELQNCEPPVNLRAWDPIPEGQVAPVYDGLGKPAEDQPAAPPTEETWEEGTPPPELISSIKPNELLGSIRLEIPGNFIRYQLRSAALRSEFANATSLQGFECTPDELRCLVNPLALYNPSNLFGNDGAFKIDAAQVTLDGETAWELSNIRFEPDLDGYPGFAVKWGGKVQITNEEPIEINLAPSRLSLLPLHQPYDNYGSDTETNSYPLTDIKLPDRQRNFLDQALLLTKLDPTTCWSFKLNPSYLTYRLPIMCNCPSNQPDLGYCVVDIYPREEIPVEILQYATTTENSWLVKCTDPVMAERYPYKAHWDAVMQGLTPDLSNLAADVEVYKNILKNIEQITLSPDQALADIIEFGCSGRISKIAPVGMQVTQSFGTMTVTTGYKATSAVGFELLTQVGMGGLKATIKPGPVEFEFQMGVQFEEWIKKKFGSFLGWLLKWVLKILAGWVNVQIEFYLPPSGIEPSAVIHFDPMEVRLQGVLSQIEQLGAKVREGFSIGMRRIVTNKPIIDKGDWSLEINFDAPDCKNVLGSADLVQKFQALIKCPYELATSIAGLALEPLLTFLAKEMLDITLGLTDKMNQSLINQTVSVVSKIEDGNIIALLLQKASYKLLWEPYYLGTLSDPVKANVGELPPHLASACALAPNPAMACTLMDLLTGNGLAGAEFKMNLYRVGAKTHYRSLEDFAALTPGTCFPPVRYCVVGDNPLGAETFDAVSRDSSQDFNEVDANPPDSLDWREQCALFIDFSAKALGFIETEIQDYEVGVWVSERTQLLLNEIFVCRNSASCDFQLPFIGKRAQLAACSILGDIWGHPKGTAGDYVNELVLLTGNLTQQQKDILAAIWNQFRKNIQLEEAQNTFEELVIFAASCKAQLTEAGFPDPPSTMPAYAFQAVDIPYECKAEFYP